MRAEIARKQRDIRRLHARTRRKEGQVMEMQERLNEILAEKSKREKELFTASKLLPSPDDILALKKRLQKARELSRKSAKKINDAEAHLLFSSSTNPEGRFTDERRRQEGRVKLKQSLTLLKDEVARLRVQLQEVTNDANANDACKDASSSQGEESTPDPACFNGPARLARLLRQRKECEARVDEATAAWRAATQREAKVTRLLHSLEKRIGPTLRVPERQRNVANMENNSTSKVENDDDFPFHHLGTGTLLVASMSRNVGPADSLGSFSSLHLESSHHMSPSKKTHSPKGRTLWGVGKSEPPHKASEKEQLSRQVKQLAVQYAQMKQQVGKLRERHFSL